MGEVASRDLRNHTADVLRRVSGGEAVMVTVRGEPVAEIRPLRSRRPRSMPTWEFLERLHQADPGLREDLAELAGDTTDDLGPIT